MRTINGTDYYTTSEVCETLGITAKTWNALRERYNIKQYTIGRLILFPATELDRVMKASETRYKPHATGRGRRPRSKNENEPSDD